MKGLSMGEVAEPFRLSQTHLQKSGSTPEIITNPGFCSYIINGRAIRSNSSTGMAEEMNALTSLSAVATETESNNANFVLDENRAEN